MNVQGNRQYSCKLKFKEQSLLDRNPRQVQGSSTNVVLGIVWVFLLKCNCVAQVQGFVEDVVGTKVASLMGKWDDSIYYSIGSGVSKARCFNQTQNASLLWKRSNPPANPNRYNLSSFAITLNELKPELKVHMPYGISLFLFCTVVFSPFILQNMLCSSCLIPIF